MTEARSSLQAAVDAATIAAAAEPNETKRERLFNSLMSAHEKTNRSFNLIEDANVIADDGELILGSARLEIDLTFGALVYGTTQMELEASAQVALGNRRAEIALVVDMSSSMIEDGRFEPARDAVKSFVDKFADGATALDNTKIAIVPFSSRVNFGMERNNFFATWNGAPAIPDRWHNPADHYNDNYALEYWIDNATPAMTRDGYHHWIGCAEPRLDVSIKRGETNFAPTDAAPNVIPFIAMDNNPQPGLTFCPPPIQPLTDNVSQLTRAADALTSQGSTRLDAGIAGAWYTLSPNWSNAWGSAHAPVSYTDAQTAKVVVFMTDGGMNTMDDPTATEYDWVCEASGDCDERAEATFLATCDAMKNDGIEVYSVSYGVYADRAFVQSCASSGSHSFVATTDEGSDDFIDTIYREIADKIRRTEPRLVN